MDIEMFLILKYSKCLLGEIFRRPFKIILILSSIKYYFRWKQSLSYPEEPWLVFAATDFLKGLPLSEFAVFEYGSGISTIFFSKKVKTIVSIEHNNIWYSEVSNKLNKENLKNCNLIWVPPQAGVIQEDISNPSAYYSSDNEYSSMNFRDYCSSIDSFPNSFFDLIIIDGRARPSCISHAYTKVKRGGWLLLDDSHREYYLMNINCLNGWEKKIFDGLGPKNLLFKKTTIWRKP